MQPYDWQMAHVEALSRNADLIRGEYAVADGSDTGTGKMHMTCAVARNHGWKLVVVCPKIIVAEWRHVAGLWGVEVTEVRNYDQYRLNLLPHCGSFQKLPPRPMQRESEGFVWCYPDPEHTMLVFDEAHYLGGIDTKNSALLIGARRQRLRTLLLSATLLQDPLHAYAIGYAMGMHNLLNFKKWTEGLGVAPVCVRPEIVDATGKMVRRAKYARKFAPIDERHAQEVMEAMRHAMGPRFHRIRKKDVPGFPTMTLATRYLDTIEMPELDTGEFGMEARVAVEREMVPAMFELIDELREGGYSVAVFVNFIESMNTLGEKYPEASRVFGGQSDKDRAQCVNSFQQDLTTLIVVNGAAGGAGLSLHDLNGRPRVGLVIPGWNAVQFQQILGRIHRAGALSPALYYVLFASGVPVMRRIRGFIETKITNIESLNDADLLAPGPADAGGALQSPERNHRQSGETDHADQRDEHHAQHVDRPDHPRDQAYAMSSQLTVPNSPSQVEHGARKHARSSPSKLKTLSLCPSFEDDPTREVHPVTLRGTAMHEAMETGSNAGLDDFEVAYVQMCRDFVAEDLARAAEVLQEIHVTTHDRDVAGFLDLMLVMPPKANGMKTALIRDWKFGFNPVPSPEVNPQAIAYVVGVFMKRPDIDEIDFAFCLPRLDLILTHTFHRSQLADLQLGISSIANRVRSEAGTTYTPHLDACQYCAQCGKCPATWDRGLAIGAGFQLEGEALPLPEAYNPQQILDPVDMAKALNLCVVLEEWCKRVRSYGLAMRKELGMEIPGYDFIEKSGVRSVVNVSGTFEIAQRHGVEQHEFLEAAKVSLPSLIKVVRDKAPAGTTKKVAEQVFVDELTNADCITKGDSFFSLQRSRKKALPESSTPALSRGTPAA